MSVIENHLSVYSFEEECKNIFRDFDLISKPYFLIDDSLRIPYGNLWKTINSPILFWKADEKRKSRDEKALIEDFLIENRIHRKSSLIIIGGGVTLDIGAFVASTLYRGISHILIPTTLLSMIDASIGGKCGVNTRQGKNLIGCFKFPEKIIFCVEFLNTLSDEIYLCGLGEMVKYAWISGILKLTELQEDIQKLKKRHPLILEKWISFCIELKKNIVNSDPFEKSGKRAVLNTGHTIGHSIESASDYKISHGIAVGLGIYLESLLLNQRQYSLNSELLLKILRELEFPKLDFKDLNESVFFETLKKDKKNISDNQIFISVPCIENFLHENFNTDEVRECMKSLNHL